MTQQTMQQNDPFYAPFSESQSDYQPLAPGVYQGVCIGVTVKAFPDFNDKSKTVDKAQFIFEVVNGDQKHFLRSAPLRLIITDKSKLFLFINSWTGATIDRVCAGFSCGKMIGWGGQLVVSNEAKDGKIYNELKNILPLAQGMSVPVVPAEIPEYLVRNVKQFALAQGITVMQPRQDTQTAAPSKVIPPKPATQLGDSSAFFGQAQQAQPQAQPQFVPPAAPAPQPAFGQQATTAAGNTYQTQQAPQVQVDDDSDLPF